MVSLITNIDDLTVKLSICGVIDRCNSSCDNDGRPRSRRQIQFSRNLLIGGVYGTLDARNHSVSTQHIAHQRLDQYRNCVPNNVISKSCYSLKYQIWDLCSRITSWHWVSSSLQRCSSSVSLPVSSVRESNLPTLGTNRCIVC